MNVAVIPARGGSKRIPRKNIKPFLGRPMIAYPVAAARQSNLFDRIIVSTDDEEIAAVAVEAGAEVPFRRPATLADDHTGTGAVVKHALEWLVAQGVSLDFTCCIYATSPFLQARFLDQGYRDLVAHPDKLFAFSITSFPFPVQRAICFNEAGEMGMIHPQFAATRSQDLPEAWHDAGQFYWARPRGFLEPHAVFAPHSLPVKLPRYLVQDIDTPEDWRRAEFLYQALQAAGEIDPTVS
jgi:pseudaminic acid cytidylyltransferase